MIPGSRKFHSLLPLIGAAVALAMPHVCAADIGLPALTVQGGPGGGQTYTLTLQVLVLMTALSLLPAILLMMTAFTRIVIVLGAIFLCAWLTRRMRNLGSGRYGAVNVIAEVRLGPKERAVLLQVGNTQLLVGVAPGRISALHVLAEPLPPQAPTPSGTEGATFKALLRKSLGK